MLRFVLVDFLTVFVLSPYLWLIPHALVVTKVTGEAAAVLPSPAVEVAGPTLEVVVNLVGDMLVGHIPHPLVTAERLQARTLSFLVNQDLEIISV